MSRAKRSQVHCLAFERLLDEGEPLRLPATALEHARTCEHCARALARARSLEMALERHFAPESAADTVPAGFTDRVMARVLRGEARGVRWLALPDALPWWTRATADPAVVLAFGVAALILWRGDGLIAAVRAWSSLADTPGRLAQGMHFLGLDKVGPAIASAFASAGNLAWAIPAGLALGLLPVFALTAFAAWRAGERLAGFAGSVRPR